MRRTPWPFLLVILVAAAAAQTKPRLTPAEYGQWETLGATSLSPDGRWLAYALNRSNRNNELRIVSVAGGEPKVAAFGAQPAFSSDSSLGCIQCRLFRGAAGKAEEREKADSTKAGAAEFEERRTDDR